MLIISVFNNPDNCPQGVLQIFSGTYQNFTHRFSSASGLKKVVVMVSVGCSYLLVSIYFLIDLKYLSFSSPNASFVDFLSVSFHWLYQLPLILIPVLGCDINFYLGHIQTVHKNLLSPRYWLRSWRGFQLCNCNGRHQLIDNQEENHPKFLLLISDLFQTKLYTRVLVNVTKQMNKSSIFRCTFLHQYLEFLNISNYTQHPFKNSVGCIFRNPNIDR